MTAFQIFLQVLILIAVPLLALYVREQVKTGVREASAKNLADYKHEHDKTLEALRAALRHRNVEFDLYTRERYRAYARVYRRYRIAVDTLSRLLGIYYVPNFRNWVEADLDEYVEDVKRRGVRIPRAVISSVRSALQIRGHDLVNQIMSPLHEQIIQHEADAAYDRARSAEALEDLYLSDAVRSQLDILRHQIGSMSVAMRRRPASADDEIGLKESMEAGLKNLHSIMRDEMRGAPSGQSVVRTTADA